jgi:plasmid stabilization system protein ParE
LNRRRVVLALAVRRDLERLADFLAAKNPQAAERAAAAIKAAIRSLETFASRGRPVVHELRELNVDFGRDGYVTQYRVEPERVVVLRIFHTLEDREG